MVWTYETKELTHVERLFPAVYGDDRYIMANTTPINAIPHILHFMWNTDNILKQAVDNLLTWRKLHPKWIFVFWSKEDIEKAMKRLLSGSILTSFNKLPVHIMRLDFSRYVILYYYGGVYADIDVKPLRSLDALLRYHSAIIAREQEAFSVSLGSHSTILTGNFLMASRPGHPFWPFLIKSIARRTSGSILNRAGPIAVDETLRAYKDGLHLAPRMSSVFLAPSSYLNPPIIEKGDATHLDMLRRTCPRLLAKKDLPWFPRLICETLKKEKRIDYSFGFKYPRHFNVSFTKHLMFNSYMKKFKQSDTVPLKSLGLNFKTFDKLLSPLPPLTDAYILEDHFAKNRPKR